MKADRLHRQYLIAKAPKSSRGHIQCFITKSWFPAEFLEVAHYIDRNRLCVRYDDHNCHLVIKSSNSGDNNIYNEKLYGELSKHHFEYKEQLIIEYGLPIFEELMNYKENCAGLSREDYENYIQEFKEVING